MRSAAYLLVLSFLLNNHLIFSQKSSSEDHVIAIAKIQKVETSGKRHNSYWFTFEIDEVLEGALKDSIIVSQEIYHDFGAVQTLSKIYPDEEFFFSKNKYKPSEVIIKFEKRSHSSENKTNSIIVWVAEKHRQKSLERLENLLNKIFVEKEVGIPVGLMLYEYNGQLFFSIKNIPKVAVETRSGSWVIATVDKQE